MIKNRNIAYNAAIDPSKIAGGIGDERFGLHEIFYVCKSTSTAQYAWLRDHVDAGHLVTTVTAAVALANAYDVIKIMPGVYDEGAVIDITQEGLKIIGSNTTGLMYGTTSMKASAADHIIFTLSANGIEIANLSFIQNNANIVISINSGTTGSAAVYKNHIHDCFFGSGTATYSIDAGGTYDAVDTIIERCGFVCGANVGARMNGTRCALTDSVFQIGTAGEGIVHTPTTGSRPDTRYLDNKFYTVDSTNSVGITVTGTPTVGMMLMDGNHFTNFADAAHCATKRTGYAGVNYFDITLLQITT